MTTKRTKTPKANTPAKAATGTVTTGKPKNQSDTITVFGIPFEQGGNSYTFGKCMYQRPQDYAYADAYAGLGGGMLNPAPVDPAVNVWNFIRFDDSANKNRRPNVQNGYVLFRRHPQDGYVDVVFVTDQQWATTYQVIPDADLSSL